MPPCCRLLALAVLVLPAACRGSGAESRPGTRAASAASVGTPASAGARASAAAAPAIGIEPTGAASVGAFASASPLAGRVLESSDVHLIEPGRPPLRRLRYRLTAGRREQVDLSTQTRVAFAAGSEPPSTPATPTLKLHASVDIRRVGSNGLAARELHIDSIVPEGRQALEPSVRADLDAVLAKLRGFESRDEIDDRGIQRERSLTSGAEDPEARALMSVMQQAFGQMAAPLPLEAVGVGARWEVEGAAEQQGITLRQLTEYELVSVDDDGGRLALRITQRAPGGKLDAGGLPFDEAEIVHLRASGDGELRFDLGRSMPSGHIESTSSVLLRTRTRGHAQDVTLDTSVRVRFEAR